MDLVERVHELVAPLTRHDWMFDGHAIPPSGLYLMFERAEECAASGLSRIVRVGGHRKGGKLPERVRASFGNPYSSPRKQQPPLQQYIQRALMRRDGLDPDADAAAYSTFDERASAEIRERFTFVVIPMADSDERCEIERALIALLAQHPLCEPSAEWLGRWADPVVAESGLWNVKHLGSRPLDESQFARLVRALGGSNDVEPPLPSSVGTAAGSDTEDERRIAESLFRSGLDWLRETYGEHGFASRRDVVWTLHKRLATVAAENLAGFEVHSAVRDPERRNGPVDIAVVDARGRLVLAANVLYEPDRARGNRDLRYAMLPMTSWEEMCHECARAERLVGLRHAASACTVLVDESGRYNAHALPEGTREEWSAEAFPFVTVTYVPARGVGGRVAAVL